MRSVVVWQPYIPSKWSQMSGMGMRMMAEMYLSIGFDFSSFLNWFCKKQTGNKHGGVDFGSESGLEYR